MGRLISTRIDAIPAGLVTLSSDTLHLHFFAVTAVQEEEMTFA